MSKHTPGPWQIMTAGSFERYGIDGGHRNNRVSIIVMGQDDEDTGIEKIEDARLIAAAPDLLEALKQAATFIDGFGVDTSDYWAIIAKAEAPDA